MPAILRARSMAALPVLLVAVLLASMASAPTASAMTNKQRVQNGYNVVWDQRGDRYAYGAAGPNRFDCSGLVYYSYRKAGFRHIPRTSSAQAGHMKRIRKGGLRRGDFVFFYNGSARPGNVYHVGIFAGWSHHRRIIVHAPGSGQRVKREAIWTQRWFAGTLRGA
jgi:cell wall-associated NlpC family hydrolase